MTATRRAALVGVALAVVCAAALGWWVLDDGGDDDRPSGASGLDGVEVPGDVERVPSDVAAELIELLERRTSLTYHATYEATGDPELLGGEVTIDELRRDGLLRSDTTTVGPDATTQTRTIVDGDATVACSRVDDEAWTCTLEQAAGGSEQSLIGSVADQLAGVDVTETDTDEVAGRPARCFAFPSEAGAGELCVDERGIPLRVAVGDTRLELVSLETDVPGDAFVPPAEPVPATEVTVEG